MGLQVIFIRIKLNERLMQNNESQKVYNAITYTVDRSEERKMIENGYIKGNWKVR